MVASGTRPEHITNPRELARYLYNQYMGYMKEQGRIIGVQPWETLPDVEQRAWLHTATQAWQLI